MKYQTTLNFGKIQQRIFTEIGSESKMSPSAIHKHNFNEFFFLEKGTLAFDVEGRLYEMQEGSLLVIPAKVIHSCVRTGGAISYFWMKSEGTVPKTTLINCPPQIISELIETMKKVDETDEYFLKMRVLLIFLCYDIFENEKTTVSKECDYDFLIDEYMGDTNLTLEVLAGKLGVSERQAERLVIKHTGKTFKQNRLEIRMGIAQMLKKSGDMSIEEIAERAGYKSYKGFCKAYNNYFGKSRQDKK